MGRIPPVPARAGTFRIVAGKDTKTVRSQPRRMPASFGRFAPTAREMLADVSRWVRVEEADITRGGELEALGFSDFDALHLACAGRGGADVFLSTDDKLLRRAERHAGQLRVRAVNPVSWISQEET